MKRLVGLVAISAVAIAAWFTWLHGVSDMPTIPESMAPVNGSIVEYWPNKQVRSERVYRNGQIQEAIYYSSDGTVVFEMSSDDA